MQKTTNIEDRILEEFRLFKLSNKNSDPRYLILDKGTYRLLKDIFDVPDYEEISTFAGWMISLVPGEETKIEFI